MTHLLSLCLLILLSLGAADPGLAPVADDPKPGYNDTPFLPGDQWRVHDSRRPRPAVVDPGKGNLPLPAPADAVILFSGKDASAWTGRGGKADWTIVGEAMVVNGTGSIKTRESFGDCQLHIEFATPEKVQGNGQGRGNSGVFLMDRYEIQVLDSYRNVTYADGQCAAVYGQSPPLVNACRGPGEWQSYDIIFSAPQFADDGSLAAPARVTVIHNGIVVHDNQEILGNTSHKSLPGYNAHGPAPIELQDHGNPMRFRNIWVRRLDVPVDSQ